MLAKAEKKGKSSGLLLGGLGVKRNFQVIRTITLTSWLPGFTIQL